MDGSILQCQYFGLVVNMTKKNPENGWLWGFEQKMRICERQWMEHEVVRPFLRSSKAKLRLSVMFKQ